MAEKDRRRDRGRRGEDEDYRAYGRPHPARPGRDGWRYEDSLRGYRGASAPDYESGYRRGRGYGEDDRPGAPGREDEGRENWRRDNWGREMYGREGYGRTARDVSGYHYGQDRYGDEYRPDERGWFDRAADEMSSWFGDEDAERRRRIDARRGVEGARSGGHRGRGPKGYTRSDERIREDVSDGLTDDGYVDASDIEVAVRGGEVTLSGTVDDRMAKHRAEDIVESIPGVRHVQNNLRVREPRRPEPAAATEAAGMATTGGASTAIAGARRRR